MWAQRVTYLRLRGVADVRRQQGTWSTRTKYWEPSVMVPENSPMLKITSGLMMAHACRFPSGTDFSSSLRQMAWQTGAHCILSIVGSLSSVTLRLPQHRTDEPLPLLRLHDVPLEIVSATGTFALGEIVNGTPTRDNDDPQSIDFHIHLSVSDSSGRVYGGHLIDGTVRTTAEVVLGSLQGVHFGRKPDPSTGFGELVVMESSTCSAVASTSQAIGLCFQNPLG